MPRASPRSVLPTTIGRPVGGSSWLRRSLMRCLKMVASNENNGEGWMRYPISPARSDSDTKSSEPTASTTPPGPLTTMSSSKRVGRRTARETAPQII